MRAAIAEACTQAGRDPAGVTLIAVSKTRSVAEIASLHRLGQSDFGENYVQEFVNKYTELANIQDSTKASEQGERLHWHFIGALQANKSRWIAERADWVHSLDRLRIAERLAEQRPAHLPPLQICIQVNISHEARKAGVAPDAVVPLAEAMAALPNLKLRGLMAIPAPSTDRTQQRQSFAKLRQILETLKQEGHAVDVLSMGMSADWQAALQEGATHLRIGTALFGPRPSKTR